LGKRAFQSRPLDRTPIDSPAAAAAALSQDLMWQTQERFAVLLDVKIAWHSERSRLAQQRETWPSREIERYSPRSDALVAFITILRVML